MNIRERVRRAPLRLFSALALSVSALVLGGCEEEADEVIELTHREALEEEEAVSVAEPGEAQNVPPVPEQGVGGEICMRARLCCQEFVATMARHSEEVDVIPGEAAGCAEVPPPGSEDTMDTCRDAIRGYAEALNAANIEVPPHCETDA